MQKKLIALAVAGLASTAAFAQSNVTVYGIVDMAGAYTDTQAAGKSQWNVSSGVLSTSRIGFKGVEDLGNGLKALFTLEYGLSADTSASIGAARQQFVGLTGNFGTAVAGRLQTTGLDYTVAVSPLAGSSTLGTIGRVGGSTLISAAGRADNAVAYISPNFGGATFAYNHARVTEAALGTNVADAYANLASVSYAAGPITAGAVYSKINMANTAASDDVKEWAVRAGYDLGVAKLNAGYQTQKVGDDAKDKKYVLAVTVPMGKAALIGEYASINRDSTAASDDAKAIAVAATYSLSKRTTAYAGVVQLNPEGGSNNVTTVATGVRHSF